MSRPIVQLAVETEAKTTNRRHSRLKGSPQRKEDHISFCFSFKLSTSNCLAMLLLRQGYLGHDFVYARRTGAALHNPSTSTTSTPMS
jgi:hypothetical protein